MSTISHVMRLILVEHSKFAFLCCHLVKLFLKYWFTVLMNLQLEKNAGTLSALPRCLSNYQSDAHHSYFLFVSEVVLFIHVPLS